MPAIVLLLFIIGLPILVYSLVMFNRVVRAGYETDRAAWEALGKPSGFFWRPPECTLFRSGWSTNRLAFVWLFKNPSWVGRSAACQVWLRRLRICVALWNVLVVAVAIYLMASRF
jgi:hypothetical protein